MYLVLFLKCGSTLDMRSFADFMQAETFRKAWLHTAKDSCPSPEAWIVKTMVVPETTL